jgi:small-conductance mechanosensitive channel
MNDTHLLTLFVTEEPADAGTEDAEIVEASTEAVTTGLVLDVDVGKYLPEELKPGWSVLQDHPLLLSVLLVTIGYVLGKAIQLVVNRLFGRLASRTKSELDDKIIRYLAAPIMQTTVTVSLILAVLAIKIPPSVEQILVRILFSLLVLFWARAWFKATHFLCAAMSGQRNRFQMFQPRTVPLFEMGIKLFLLAIFVYLFFTVWGIDATAWLASAGVVGIAVGFAAKDTLANLISGVSIVADSPYKIGDYIVLDTGERGIVTSLGIRSTRLLTRDEVEISIPNAVIGAAKITNESGGPWVKQRIRVPIGVAYGSDTGKVVRILEEIAKENTGIVDSPAARVRMRTFGESSLNFEMLGWINTPEQRGLVKHQLLLEIDRRFREEDIQIPFPQRDIHIHKTADEGDPGSESSTD